MSDDTDEDFEARYRRFQADVDRDMAEQWAIIDAEVLARRRREWEASPLGRLTAWIKGKLGAGR